MNTLLRISLCTLVLTAAMGAAQVQAAEVRSGISTRETYVGMPVTFQVQVANAKEFDPPTLPEIPGLRIESVGTPARSTQTTIINGSVSTRSSVTYSFRLTPTRPGTFQIPAIEVQADGETLSTRQFDFVASKSETGDLLFVEIAGREKEIYVGQALDLALRIWIRPYRDAEHNITLSEGDMWQLLSERTQWGPFDERIEELAEANQRPVGVEVLRDDSDGASHSYYLYEIDATIYPKKPGRIDADDVQVIALYPTAIGQSRDPFAGIMDDMGFPGRGSMFNDNFFTPFAPRLEIESVRPIVAEAQVDPIDVREIPVAGRPADYRGAVGKYRIAAQASPTDVKAGDPITLNLLVAGTGPMDLVQAPPLADLPKLTKNFKVPNEPLAGFVEGANKVFSTTIRPRQAGITEIPSIPFTYFDPEIGKFVTAHSDPIAINVAPAEMLALADVVGRGKGSSKSLTPLAAGVGPSGPVLANLSGSELLVNQSSPASVGQGLWYLLALPPIVVLGLLIARSRDGFAFIAMRFRSANRKFVAEVERATRPDEIATALKRLLARRFRLAANADDAELVGALRTGGYRNLAVRCERLLQQCEIFGGVAAAGMPNLSELKQQAISLVDDLDSERRPESQRVARPVRRMRTTAAAILAAAAVFSTAASARADVVTATTLTTAQQQVVLAEATEHYDAALKSAAEDSAEAKEAFAHAAAKYQLLVDSGVENAGLYFNLGNAYLESGVYGRAIANYRRALILEPTNRDARTNLGFAQAALAGDANDTAAIEQSWSEQTAAVNDFLNHFVSPRLVLTVAVASWFAFWIALGLRLLDVRFAWKSTAVATLSVAIVAGASYALSWQSLNLPSAVVVAPAVELRSGDGDTFPQIDGVKIAEGQSVEYLRHRGDWVQIRTTSGQAGWIPGSTVEVL